MGAYRDLLEKATQGDKNASLSVTFRYLRRYTARHMRGLCTGDNDASKSGRYRSQ